VCTALSKPIEAYFSLLKLPETLPMEQLTELIDDFKEISEIFVSYFHFTFRIDNFD
jgi:hypothetical protein